MTFEKYLDDLQALRLNTYAAKTYCFIGIEFSKLNIILDDMYVFTDGLGSKVKQSMDIYVRTL